MAIYRSVSMLVLILIYQGQSIDLIHSLLRKGLLIPLLHYFAVIDRKYIFYYPGTTYDHSIYDLEMFLLNGHNIFNNKVCHLITF